MTDFRAPWIEQALSRLPEEPRVIERNAAITATYAELYLRRRDLFKWAGMAAFASYQVGTALKPLGLGILAAPLRNDLELVRATNNAVYADIAWAHVAYEQRGIEELRRCLGSSEDYALLLEGFEYIDSGARSHSNGGEDIWRGNEALLKHEQERTVQPRFDRFGELFEVALTYFTMLDFDADAERLDLETLSAFSPYMFRHGLESLMDGFSLPNVANFRQRWFWITNSLLPEWKRIDAGDPELVQKMTRFVSRLARV